MKIIIFIIKKLNSKSLVHNNLSNKKVLIKFKLFFYFQTINFNKIFDLKNKKKMYGQ